MKLERQKTSKCSKILHSAWIIRLEGEKAQEGYYFFPDNHAEIIVALKGSFTHRIVGTRKEVEHKQGESVLAKARSRGMVIQSSEDVTLLLFKIHPQYLNIFSKSPSYRFRDDVQKFTIPISLNFEWKNALYYKDVKLLISIMELYIRELEASGLRSMDSIIEETIALIRQQRGEIKIKELNEIFGICKSTLEQKFSREVGISPKEFCKIEKLSHFLKNYEAFNHEMTLTQLTFKSGYYDQSHLIKDFKYYVDDSPKRFLNNANKVMLYA